MHLSWCAALNLSLAHPNIFIYSRRRAGAPKLYYKRTATPLFCLANRPIKNDNAGFKNMPALCITSKLVLQDRRGDIQEPNAALWIHVKYFELRQMSFWMVLPWVFFFFYRFFFSRNIKENAESTYHFQIEFQCKLLHIIVQMLRACMFVIWTSENVFQRANSISKYWLAFNDSNTLLSACDVNNVFLIVTTTLRSQSAFSISYRV